jgi:hypothetical protein
MSLSFMQGNRIGSKPSHGDWKLVHQRRSNRFRPRPGVDPAVRKFFAAYRRRYEQLGEAA